MRKIDLCYRWRCKVGGYFDVGRKKSPPPRLAEEADRAARGNYWRKIFAVVENAAHFDCDFHIFCCWDISVVGLGATGDNSGYDDAAAAADGDVIVGDDLLA